jgi:enoyl-CoA hydratase
MPHPAATDALLVDIDSSRRIATLTLNRPEKRNALSNALARDIRAAMAKVDLDDDVDVIILTGADPAFCAGVDLKEIGSSASTLIGPSGSAVDSNAGNAPGEQPATAKVTHPWEPTTKPVIGAINGVAITGGFELALQCDFLVASERAMFGDTHARVGILPGWGLSVLLPQAIGYRRALEMSLTGNFLSADEAMHFGLVNHVVAHGELIPTAHKLAIDMVNNNQDSLRELLKSYRAIHRMTVGDGEVHEATVSRNWLRKTYSPELVEARRRAIMERGRTQG